MKKEYRQLDAIVYPSNEKTISVIRVDGYDGAHVYYAKNHTGSQYIGSEQQIRFAGMIDNGSIVPGVQEEQVANILLDRVQHLPKTAQTNNKIKALMDFINLCREEKK